MRDTTRRLVTHWVPVGLWMGVIFVLSASSDPLHGIRLPFFADKLLHGGEFAVLGLLAARAFRAAAPAPVERRFRVWAITLAVVYGLSDEWHQSLIPSRTVEVADVVADGLGAGLAVFCR